MRRSPQFTGSILLAFALASCGEAAPSLETRTFTLQHLSPWSAYEIIEPYVFDRPGAEGSASMSEQARTVTVREHPDNLDRIQEVLAELDRPRGTVELRFHVIEAGPDELDPDPAIAAVESALREAFRFQGYRLVGEAVVRTAEHSDFRQNIGGSAAHAIHGRVEEVTGGSGDPRRARVGVVFWSNAMTRALETTVNVTDARTIVIGTAGSSDPGRALILAVHAVFD